MIECFNCGFSYDGTRHRWMCPQCRTRDTCCDGAPQWCENVRIDDLRPEQNSEGSP